MRVAALEVSSGLELPSPAQDVTALQQDGAPPNDGGRVRRDGDPQPPHLRTEVDLPPPVYFLMRCQAGTSQFCLALAWQIDEHLGIAGIAFQEAEDALDGFEWLVAC